MLKLPFLKKENLKENKILTLTISSTEVLCLCIYLEEIGNKIIGTGQKTLEPNCVRNGVILNFEEVLDAAKYAIEEATIEIEDEINNIIIGVNADISTQNVTTAKIKRSTNEPISNKDVIKYDQKIENAAVEKAYKSVLEQSGRNDIDLDLFYIDNVYTKIDNEFTETVLNQQGISIELAKYFAFCPTEHIKTLKKLSKKLKLNLVLIAPTEYALVKALNKTELESNDFVSINIGTDYTSVSVVFGGAVVSNKNMHIGYTHFLEQISQIMGISYEEAEKLIRSHNNGDLNQSESVVVQNCLEDVLKTWFEGLELLFTEFEKVKTFSNFIYVYGKGVAFTEIIEKLDSTPWAKSIPFKAPPQITVLESGAINTISDATGRVKNSYWIPNMVAALLNTNTQ